jgi:hypothetical protein
MADTPYPFSVCEECSTGGDKPYPFSVCKECCTGGGGYVDNTTKIIRDTVIAEKQFYQGVGLEGIKTVILPNVQTIGNLAFTSAYEIETIDIGADVTKIDPTAFNNCTKLKRLIFRGKFINKDDRLVLANTVISQKKEGAYIYVPDEYLNQYKEADNWSYWAEETRDRIKPISEMETDGADVSGVTATADDVLAGKKIVTKDGELVSGTMPNKGAIAEVLGEGETITIPKGYHNGEGTVTAASIIKTIDETEIADSEYYKGKGLKGVKILNLPNVENIGERAFYNATELETVDIGENVTKILFDAFDGCSSLKTLIIRAPHTTGYGSQLNLFNTPIRDKADGAYIYVPEDYVEQYKSNSGSFAPHKDRIKPLSELPSTKVTLNVTNVEANQFANLKCIKEFNLPYVEKIAGNAFVYSGVETVDIGASISEFSSNAFVNASKLTTLIIRGTLKGTAKPLTLTGTPFFKKIGYIYVPDGSIDRYKQYEFSAVADKVKPLSELKSGGGGAAEIDTIINNTKIVGSAIFSGVIKVATSDGSEIEIKKAKLPNVTSIYSGVFGSDSCIEVLDVGSGTTSMTLGGYSFAYNSNLKTLIFRGRIEPCGGGSYVELDGTPILEGSGYIYVPDDLLEWYKSSSGWSDIAAQIKPISEL